jgi:transposase
MIDYQTYCQIRHLFSQKHLSLRQIARELKLGFHTVRKWARRESYQRASIPKRPSKLDAFKGDIIRLLEQHDYSAQQIFQQLKELGYQGRSSILRAFVSEVRPKQRAAFLLAETLEHFLACHLHAFEYFEGVVRDVWVDDCKVAVLSRAASLCLFSRFATAAWHSHYGNSTYSTRPGIARESAGGISKRAQLCSGAG